MTNPNVIRGIGSVERFKLHNQSERPFYQDEKQFYTFHPPMPTENGKQLQEFFDERTEIEKGMSKLEEEARSLVNKFDDLNNHLAEVQTRATSSVEEEQAKQSEIASIQAEIQKIMKELMKVRKKIEEKEEEIDRVNEKINEMIKIVIEDEHKLVQQQQELEKEKNDKKVDELIFQL